MQCNTDRYGITIPGIVPSHPQNATTAKTSVTIALPVPGRGLDFRLRLEDDAGEDINTVAIELLSSNALTEA